MFNRLTRNFIGLTCWLCGLLGLLGLNAVVVSSNYVGCKIAFELLGFETRPLREDELIGWFFRLFAPDATLAHLFALGISITVAAGIFILLRLASNIYHLNEERGSYLVTGDHESARLAKRLIVRDVGLVILIMVPILLLANWDIDLYRFRSIAGSLNMEYPEDTIALKRWSLQLEQNGHLFAWQIAKWGAWGYLAVTALACLGLEYALLRISEYWARLISVFEVGQSLQSEQTLYGFDAAQNPVYDREAPVAFDLQGRQIFGYTDAWQPVLESGKEVTFDWQGFAVTPADEEVVPDRGLLHNGVDARDSNKTELLVDNVQPGGDGALFESFRPEDGQESEPACIHDERSTEGENAPVDVVGSAGARVTREMALDRPESYHVDQATGAIWTREYWDLIHNIDPEPESHSN